MGLAAAAAFAGASVQSATGFGFALVSSPALFAVLDPLEAVSALLVLGLALNLLVLLDAHGGTSGGRVRWDALGPVLGFALPGLGLGVALLALLPKAPSRWWSAAGSSAPPRWSGASRSPPGRRDAGGLRRRSGQRRSDHLGQPERAPASAVAAGQRAVACRAAGLAASGLSRAQPCRLRAAPGCRRLVRRGRARLLEPLLGLVVVGHLAGARLFRRLDPERFSTLVLALVAAGGVASVAAGLAAS